MFICSSKKRRNSFSSSHFRCRNTPLRFKDATALLNYGFSNYESTKLCTKNDNIATLTLDKAEDNKVNLVAKENLSVLLKKGSNKDFTRKIKVYDNPTLPIKKGTVLGKVGIYKDKKLVGQVDLVVQKI